MVISLDPKQHVSFEELLLSRVVQQAEKPNRRGSGSESFYQAEADRAQPPDSAEEKHPARRSQITHVHVQSREPYSLSIPSIVSAATIKSTRSND